MKAHEINNKLSVGHKLLAMACAASLLNITQILLQHINIGIDTLNKNVYKYTCVEHKIIKSTRFATTYILCCIQLHVDKLKFQPLMKHN